MTWERRGECNHCGYCCSFFGPVRQVVPVPDAAAERYYAVRGQAIAQTVDARGRRGKVALVLMHAMAPCPEHVPEDSTITTAPGGRCRIYHERPAACRTFPERPAQIESTPCSYWFELGLPSGGVERRGGGASPYPTPARFGGAPEDGTETALGGPA